MEMDVYNLKGIKVGDWIESSYLKWYFKVCQIKPCYRDRKDVGYLLLLKKVLTPTMKFSFTTEKCHVVWCEKLSESKAREIEHLLNDNPTKKKKFDELPPLFPCIQNLYFLDVETEQIENIREKLQDFPRYFTEEQFDHFVIQTGLKSYIKPSSEDPENAITFTIDTQEWMVDSDRNMLFCNPQIGNAWGKLARLDAEEWDDFQISPNKLSE